MDLLGSRRKKERKKEKSGLGMLSTSSYTQKTGVWVLFFFFLGHRLSSGDAFDYSQLVEVVF